MHRSARCNEQALQRMLAQVRLLFGNLSGMQGSQNCQKEHHDGADGAIRPNHLSGDFCLVEIITSEAVFCMNCSAAVAAALILNTGQSFSSAQCLTVSNCHAVQASYDLFWVTWYRPRIVMVLELVQSIIFMYLFHRFMRCVTAAGTLRCSQLPNLGSHLCTAKLMHLQHSLLKVLDHKACNVSFLEAGLCSC